MRLITGLGMLGLAVATLGYRTIPRAEGLEKSRPAPRYQVTDLGVFPGRDLTEAVDLNDHGVIVGRAYDYSGEDAVALVWHHGKPTRLAAPPGYRATGATAINVAGQIVGSVEKTYRGTRYVYGCLWTDRKPQLLPTPRSRHGTATDINASGLVVGWSMVGSPPIPRGWSWRDGRITLLPVPPGRPVTRQCSVNDAGLIAGVSEALNRNPNGFAVLWEPGRMNAPPTLLGRLDTAFQIDHRGRVVGSVSDEAGGSRAVLWEGGRMRDLGTLGGANGLARSINDRGQVVGNSELEVIRKPGSDLAESEEHAFLWEAGRMLDLNALIPHGSGRQLTAATAINRQGEIIATGQHNGRVRPVLLTPILPPH